MLRDIKEQKLLIPIILMLVIVMCVCVCARTCVCACVCVCVCVLSFGFAGVKLCISCGLLVTVNLWLEILL